MVIVLSSSYISESSVSSAKCFSNCYDVVCLIICKYVVIMVGIVSDLKLWHGV